MASQEYSIAFAETLDILGHTNIDDVNKIPKKFIKFLEDNASNKYKSNLDYTKSIKNMGLNIKTIGILSIITRNYWCNDEQRKDFDLKLQENERLYDVKKRKKYNPNNIFKDNNINTTNNYLVLNDTETKDLIKKNDISIFKQILNNILNLFSKFNML